MRILLSAYACEPGKGSEPGVGWHWATELACLGHEVVVITRTNNRDSIEEALRKSPIGGLSFQYYDLPAWAMWWKRGPSGVQLYYLLWQVGAYRQAKWLQRKRQFDLAHHLTFGMFRQPSFMGRLGIPFIVGPLGGGEMPPAGLLRSFPARHRIVETLRIISNRMVHWDPAVFAMFRRATLIFCKTGQTLATIPKSCQSKCLVYPEVGIDPALIAQEVPDRQGSAEFLFVGRIVYWKGLHLAIKALAELLKIRPDATLTVIGAGPDESRLKKLSSSLGIQDAVRWLGWRPQQEIWEFYKRHTALIFPSLHDSSGNVLLEAISQALPVICLDTGGPGTLISSSFGVKIPVADRNEAQVVGNLAAAMQELAGNPELRIQMRRHALEAARSSTWSNVVSGAYNHIHAAMAAS